MVVSQESLVIDHWSFVSRGGSAPLRASAPLGVPPVVAPGVGLSASSATAVRVLLINFLLLPIAYLLNPPVL